MFTGIITNLGIVIDKSENKLTIKTGRTVSNELSTGASIAVNGICLTVVHKSKDEFIIDYMPETDDKTNIKYLKTSDLVNLELPVKANSLLSGHIVQGHADGIGKIEEIKKEGNSKIFTIKIPSQLSKYIVEKGSIAINGISLTVIDTHASYFNVGIIPYTWKHTMLHKAHIGDLVNIEVDILAKYLEKLFKERST
ncbi:riboflavin synthase [Candidatus Gottesmanbacteria bacterium]|nr:riboflavin synthase [Candidatus Gottesmanbacteria bacterium]